MSLYLVRHGPSYPEAADPDRPLTEAGKLTVNRMAELTCVFKIPVLQIRHSGKTRAKQTAEIFYHYLKPSAGVMEIEGIGPFHDVAPIAAGLDASKNIMLVGHLPFMQRLVSYLVTGSPDRSMVRFQNGGIVCLDQEYKDDPWHIKWALMPEMQ